MMNAKRKDRGFTLIELLVTMAIMVGVVFAAGGAIMLLTRSMDTTHQLTSDNSAARLTMMRLTREVRSASWVGVEIRELVPGSTDGLSEAQNLYLYFADSKISGTYVLYYRNPISGQLARIEGTYSYILEEDEEEPTLVRNETVASTDTGLLIRRISTRIDYDDRDRGWLYLRIRADHSVDLDTSTYDQNLLLDTRIALNRLVT